MTSVTSLILFFTCSGILDMVSCDSDEEIVMSMSVPDESVEKTVFIYGTDPKVADIIFKKKFENLSNYETAKTVPCPTLTTTIDGKETKLHLRKIRMSPFAIYQQLVLQHDGKFIPLATYPKFTNYPKGSLDANEHSNTNDIITADVDLYLSSDGLKKDSDKTLQLHVMIRPTFTFSESSLEKYFRMDRHYIKISFPGNKAVGISYTPTVSGSLKGVTRKRILDLCPSPAADSP